VPGRAGARLVLGTLTWATFVGEQRLVATRLTCMIMLILAARLHDPRHGLSPAFPAALAAWVEAQQLSPYS
jgi:hypothetical protein